MHKRGEEMSRTKSIINLIRNSSEGVDTKTISKILGLDRANVSRILNQLVEKGDLKKVSGKPVLYFYQSNNVHSLSIENFEKENPSLNSAIEKAKSSILYPPMGINTMIVGETGVGKSHFAGMMYNFSKEMGIIGEKAPFILFNCADYARNPELLMGMLFGVKKGAYTGAEEDRPGLIEQANHGMLFLDEIHNLPQEGQEILFTFMDQGIFRRLGESVGQRKASVRIIGATSESVVSKLVSPFRRRMPMLIEIPNLKNRTDTERANLIQSFFKNEAKVLKQEIYIEQDVFVSLLYYDCPHNIGQLKSDIQLLCAKAYSEFLIGSKKSIIIDYKNLPKIIAQGLLDKTEHRALRIQSDFFSNEKICFTPEDNFQCVDQSIYPLLEDKVSNLSDNHIASSKMKKIIEKDIDAYFSAVAHSEYGSSLMSFETIIEENQLETIKKIVKIVKSELEINWDQNSEMGFILHLNHLIEGAKNNRDIPEVDEEINLDYQIHYRKEFLLALKCIQLISFEEKIQIPYSEANNLVSFFILSESSNTNKINIDVKVIVIAHGDNTASSMVNTVQQLLNTNNIHAFDAPLSKKPSEIFDEINKYLISQNQIKEVLLLVDMGSFLQFSDELEIKLHKRVKALPLVSTLHVLEAARKSLLGEALEDIYNDLLKVNFGFFGFHPINLPQKPTRKTSALSTSKKPIAIVTCCLTGHGTAKYLKELIEKELKDEFPNLQIFPIQLNEQSLDEEHLRSISSKVDIISIVSTFPLNYPVPQYNVSDMISGNGLEKLREHLKDATLGDKIKIALKKELDYVNGEELFDDLLLIHQTIEVKLKVVLTRNELIGVLMHTAIMINQLKKGVVPPKSTGEKFIFYEQSLRLLHSCFFDLEKTYGLTLTDNDLFPILEYYLHLH